MERGKRFFWLGVLLGAGVFLRWVGGRLGEADGEAMEPAGGYAAPPPPAVQPPQPSQKAAGPPPPADTAVDPLEEINGIGATYARRLRAAGIHTFADLAALTPEEARAAAKAQPWQANPADWIAQAKEKMGA